MPTVRSLAATALVLLVTAAGTKSFPVETKGAATPPLPFDTVSCSWRWIQNNHSAFNIWYPDANSVYHVTLHHLNAGDAIRIEADSLPYARYFSVQTYDMDVRLPTDSAQDVFVDTVGGPNAYANFTAAKNEVAQGGYTIYVTANGTEGLGSNELRGLYGSKQEGLVAVFLRLYDVQHKPPSSPNGVGESQLDSLSEAIRHREQGMTDMEVSDIVQTECWDTTGLNKTDDAWAEVVEDVKRWGWACPPTVAVRERDGTWQDMRRCGVVREEPLNNYNKTAPPKHECTIGPNHMDNFLLPSTLQQEGEFSNYDASYMMACGDTTKVPTGSELWARVESTLPQTPLSLYMDPVVADEPSTDIRYVSISTVNRSPPQTLSATLQDSEIVDHYLNVTTDPSGQAQAQAQAKARLTSTWDRKFVVWIGPAGSQVPREALDENSLSMEWPQVDDDVDEAVPYPGVLYRQILTQSQIEGSEATFRHGIDDIIPEDCEQKPPQDHIENPECPDKLCCGKAAPDCCRSRSHALGVMHEFYPSVRWFWRDGERSDSLLHEIPHGA